MKFLSHTHPSSRQCSSSFLDHNKDASPLQTEVYWYSFSSNPEQRSCILLSFIGSAIFCLVCLTKLNNIDKCSSLFSGIKREHKTCCSTFCVATTHWCIAMSLNQFKNALRDRLRRGRALKQGIICPAWVKIESDTHQNTPEVGATNAKVSQGWDGVFYKVNNTNNNFIISIHCR